MPLWEEAVRQHGRLDGVRYRLARWMGDGSSLVVVSDEGGEDAIELHDPAKPTARRLEGLDLGCITGLATPPGGTVVAVANHRHELFLVDTEKGSARLLDRSDNGGLDGVVWSPDGRWLAYSFAATTRTRSIKLCRLETGETTLVTRPEFRDVHPSWDPEGRFLYFLSYRTFDPVYDSLYFDLGFPKAMRPYLVTLSAGEPSPFVPRPRGFGPPTQATEPAKAEEGETARTIAVDLDGISERVVAFPMPEGRYSQVVGIKGKVLFTAWPVQGSLGRDVLSGNATGPRGSLEVWDLADQRHDMLVGGISDFEVSRDGHTLAYRAGRRLRAVKAGDKPSDSDGDGPGRRSGWLDLDRVRVSVDPGAEWAQMFKEAWRLQRDHFWVEDMSGVDWWLVLDRYLPLIHKVATRIEFSDLMWEMQGELGTSHAYELGGDYRPAPAYALGHLAADLAFDRGKWRFTHVVEGDPWDPEYGSPLQAPGVRVKAGDILLAVNGRAVGAEITPASLLVHQAGLAVELTVAGPRGKDVRTVVVSALRDERGARYREWVASNRRKVHEATGGRVGYVHVPDMGPRGYAEFHRSYLAEVEREAVVVDVRFNGGGHVSQLVLEKLARRRIGYDISRWGRPQPYPADSPAGPLVAVTNEHAGSDGDIFTHCFKLLGLGPVVGKRTWGGVIGISPKHVLVDGSLTTQPEYAFWFSDVGWAVENYGTDPDIEVDIRPQEAVAGQDPQLDKAVALALSALRRHRPLQADVARRPSLVLPELPPRGQDGDGRRATPGAPARTAPRGRSARRG
jgi:tricorn protease